MKYLKLFRGHSGYTEYRASDSFMKPNVSHCVEEDDVHYNPIYNQNLVIKFTLDSAETVRILATLPPTGGTEPTIPIGPTMSSVGGEQTMGTKKGGSSMSYPFSAIIIDGDMQRTDTLTSTSMSFGAGHHIVEYVMEDNITITSGMLLNCYDNIVFDMEIPHGIEFINDSAFPGTTVREVSFPSTLHQIGKNAFNDCVNLTSIKIPDNVGFIGMDAFFGCSALTDVYIGKEVSSIGYGAFNLCSSVTGMTVNGENINYDSREDCNAIIRTSTNTLMFGCGNTVIPNTITTIEEGAFQGCQNLTSITIPDSVTEIGYDAFANCRSLEEVSIGSGFTTYPHDEYTALGGIFGLCFSLSRINVSPNNQVFDSRNNCNAVIETTTNKLLVASNGTTTIPSSVTVIGPSSFSSCFNLTEITIPNSVTVIERGAFGMADFQYGYTPSLSSVTIGSGVTSSSGSFVFNGIPSLKTVNILDGCTFIGERWFSFCPLLSSVTIPNTVTTIQNGAFMYSSGITTINIPEGVTALKEGLFMECYGLSSLTIPNSVTTIEKDAIRHCSGLTSVIIGSGVTSIERSAFYWLSNITSITCNAMTAPTIRSDEFEAINKNGTLYVPVGSTGYNTWMTRLGSGWTKIEQ